MNKSNFVELSQVCDLIKGKTGLMKAKAGKYPLVATGKDRRTCDTYQFDAKAVCVPLVSSTGHGHASLKYVHYQEGKFALGTILVAVIPKDENVLNAQFLHLYLSRLKDEILVPLMTGAANVTLTVTKLKTVKVPLPPIEEQLRIVSLFNRMDNEQAELTDEISNQQELLKKLRQSILQEAIEGKLTASWREQNSDVESASILLEKIKAEKEQLIKEKKIKKQKPLPPIGEDEIPFDIPDSWEWCRLGDLCKISSGKGFQKAEYSKVGVRLFQIANVSLGKTSWDTIVNVPFNYLEQYPELQLFEGDLVMALNRPLLGRKLKVAKLEKEDVPSLLYQRVGRFDFFIKNATDWIFLYLNTKCFSDWLYEQIKGVNIPFVNQTKLYQHMIPLPPLEEQKEIVKKIEKLFKICDELETQIDSSKVNSEMLMQAVLKEAFEQKPINEDSI